jgi:hypothetical protein
VDIGGSDGGGGGGVRGGAVALALLGSRRGRAADALARAARSRPRVAGRGAAALASLGSRRGQAADAVASSARSRLRARWGRVSSARGCIRGRLRR